MTAPVTVILLAAGYGTRLYPLTMAPPHPPVLLMPDKDEPRTRRAITQHAEGTVGARIDDHYYVVYEVRDIGYGTGNNQRLVMSRNHHCDSLVSKHRRFIARGLKREQ